MFFYQDSFSFEFLSQIQNIIDPVANDAFHMSVQNLNISEYSFWLYGALSFRFCILYMESSLSSVLSSTIMHNSDHWCIGNLDFRLVADQELK